MKSGIYKTPNGNLIYVAKDRTIKATTLSPSSWPGTKVSHRAKDDTVLIEGTTYRCERVGDVPNGCNDPVKALNDTKHALQAKAALSDGVSPEWKAGREDKQFSSKIVYGHGAGFLGEREAAIERALLQNAEQMNRLAAFGVIRHIAHDEWEVVNAGMFAKFLSGEWDGKDIYKAVADQVYGVTEAMADVGKAAVRATSAARALSAGYGRDFAEQQERMRALGYRRCHKQSARKHRKQGHAVIAAGDGAFWWKASAAA